MRAVILLPPRSPSSTVTTSPRARAANSVPAATSRPATASGARWVISASAVATAGQARMAATRQAALAVPQGRRHEAAAIDVAGMAFLPARLVLGPPAGLAPGDNTGRAEAFELFIGRAVGSRRAIRETGRPNRRARAATRSRC